MVRNKTELIEQIKTFVGENTSDEALSVLEDVADTFADLESRLTDKEDWKKKFEENDKEWRTKYINRFNAPVNNGADDVLDNPPADDNEGEDEKELTFENLFKTN